MSRGCRCFLWLTMVLATLLLGGNALALEPDPRSFAMGGAYTAVVDDATAVFWNPAALGEVKWAGAQFGLGGRGKNLNQLGDFLNYRPETGEKLPEADVDAALGAGINLAFLNHVGLGVNGGVDSLSLTTVEQSGTAQIKLEARARAEAALGVAMQVTKPPFNLGALALGGAIKYLSVQERTADWSVPTSGGVVIGGGTGTDEEGKATGFGLDLGMRAKVTDLVVVGVKVQDLIVQASSTADSTYRPDLSPKLRAGVAFRPPTGTILAADLEQNGTLHLGAEQNLFWNALSLRAGMITGGGQPTQYRVGLGFNLWALHMDVAAGVIGQGFSAMLGLSAKF